MADANYLQHHYTPTFNEADLLNIDRYNVYTSTTVNNRPVTPFSMDLTKDLTQEKALRNPKVAEMVKQLSRLKFGKDRSAVEEGITQRARL